VNQLKRFITSYYFLGLCLKVPGGFVQVIYGFVVNRYE